MSTLISLHEALVLAARTKWPELFTERMTKLLLEGAEQVRDEGQRLLGLRNAMLNAAAHGCGRCQGCDLCKNRHGGAVFGDGRAHARVFIIGEGPGQFEQRTLIPFTHLKEYRSSRCFLSCARHDECFPEISIRERKTLPADLACRQTEKLARQESVARAKRQPVVPFTTAVYLDDALSGLFTRDSWNATVDLFAKPRVISDLYITNVVKCRSVNSQGDDTAPGAAHVKACYEWLHIQLHLVQPEVVILLGRVAGQMFLGSSYSVIASHGEFKPVEAVELKRPLPASVQWMGMGLHPSAIGRMGDPAEQEKAVRLMRALFVKARGALEQKPERRPEEISKRQRLTAKAASLSLESKH